MPLRGDLIDDEDFSFDEKGSGDKSDEDYEEDYEEDDEKDIHKHKEKDKVLFLIKFIVILLCYYILRLIWNIMLWFVSVIVA